MPTSAELLIFGATTGVIVVLALKSTPFRNLPVAAAHVALAALMLVGHLFGRNGTLYPLDRWAMYTTAQAPRQYFIFEIHSLQGRESYPFHSLAPAAPGPWRGYSMLSPLPWRLLKLQSACGCSSGAPELDQLINALVSLHERRTTVAASKFTIHAVPVALDGTQQRPLPLYVWVPGSSGAFH